MAAERVARTGAAALALRLAGAGFEEVADTLGLPSASEARKQVEETLSARAWGDQEGRMQLRAEAAARIERLLRSVWPKAMNADHPEHLPAVRVARELVDRHIKLFGLDAPTEVVVHSPTTAEIETWVSRVLSANDPLALEAVVVE